MNLRQLFLQHIAPTSPNPMALQISKAQGVFLYDENNTAYLDLIAGIAVSNVGHCHPKVVQAIQEQAASYMHTLVYGEMIMSPQVQLAKYLCDLLPSSLNSVYFTNSGTEATEGAMKLAKRFTGKSEIIACYKSYHGSTQGALSILGDEYFKQAFRPLIPDCNHILYNNFKDIEKITTKTAAVFVELVQAEAGVIVADTNWIKALRTKCNETGTLLVVDEIQTGCGRTGTMFRLDAINVMPDILLLAKGLGGGMPIGCFIADKQIMDSFTNNPVLGHITTFGGNAVCCAAALASLKVIVEEKLYQSVHHKNKLFLELLQHPKIKKITHCGLMMAVHLDNFDAVQKIIQYGLNNGLVTDWFLFADNCLRIAPPLIITEDEIKQACTILLAGLNELE